MINRHAVLSRHEGPTSAARAELVEPGARVGVALDRVPLLPDDVVGLVEDGHYHLVPFVLTAFLRDGCLELTDQHGAADDFQ